MKTRKFMNKVACMLDKQKREQAEQRQELLDALRLLKKKQKELLLQLKECQDPAECQQLQEKISILKAQRGKGIGRLRSC